MEKIDPVTLEVVSNYLVSAVREMGATLRRTAYSTILRESMDCSAALFDVKGQLIAQADHVPSHQGSLAFAARRISETMSLDPEDVVILNHPYEGGTHHPDILVFKPIFVDGILCGLSAALGHHIDVGGRSPGSISSDARDVFEEGLIIPPLKLYRKGELIPEILEMITANVRVPEKTMGDIRAEIAAVAIGQSRYVELAQKYGRVNLETTIQACLDNSEKLMREDLSRLPDGSFSATGYLDSDGISDDPVPITVNITKERSEVIVDFSGSSPQVEGPFNCSLSSVYSAVYAGVRYMVSPLIMQNEGCYRPIQVVRPEGTIVNPRRPAPISGRFTTLERIADTIVLAFNTIRGDDQVASGVACVCSFAVDGVESRSGRPFVCFEIFGGGWGATAKGDGLDASFGLMANCYDTPIEAVEMEYPLRVENYNFIPDSGGAGKYRGGLGFYRDTRYLAERGHYTNRSETSLFPPPGVLGGEAGTTSNQRLLRAGGETEPLPSKITNLTIRRGDTIEMAQPGGGGYGRARDRNPERVFSDWQDGKVSSRSALEIYAVVIDTDSSELDLEATQTLRSSLEGS